MTFNEGWHKKKKRQGVYSFLIEIYYKYTCNMPFQSIIPMQRLFSHDHRTKFCHLNKNSCIQVIKNLACMTCNIFLPGMYLHTLNFNLWPLPSPFVMHLIKVYKYGYISKGPFIIYCLERAGKEISIFGCRKLMPHQKRCPQWFWWKINAPPHNSY